MKSVRPIRPTATVDYFRSRARDWAAQMMDPNASNAVLACILTNDPGVVGRKVRSLEINKWRPQRRNWTTYCWRHFELRRKINNHRKSRAVPRRPIREGNHKAERCIRPGWMYARSETVAPSITSLITGAESLWIGSRIKARIPNQGREIYACDLYCWCGRCRRSHVEDSTARFWPGCWPPIRATSCSR